MGEKPRETSHRIVPMIAYEDAATAIDWLGRAFGFRERGQRYTESDGRVSHAELEFANAPIFVATPTREYQSPRHHRETCAASRKWAAVPWVVDGIQVEVEDVDALGRAQAAGAVTLSEPRDNRAGGVDRAE